MSNVNSFLDPLIHKKDKADKESYRKGKFFLISVLLFVIISILFTIYFFIARPEDLEFNLSNIFLCLELVILVVLYKFFCWRLFLTNLMALFSAFGMYFTYEKTGGIYSIDNIWTIVLPVWMFLVANRKWGIFWFIVSLLQVTFLFYAEAQGWKDFAADASLISAGYLYSCYLCAIIMVMIIIAVNDKNKEEYMNEVQSAKIEIEIKSKELEAQKEDIISSINYAKRIQYAVLPHEETIYRSIPLSFILYKPKDIVSGDFFWFHEIDKDNYILVCADCTGHGVPGAFMTVIGSSLLNQIVIDNKIIQPSKILSELDQLINMTLKQQKEHEHYVQDGMDLALLRVNKSTKEFIFTSAKRPAILIRDKQLQEFKGSKFTLGGMVSGTKVFEEIKMNYQEEDVLYMFTDGYTDQFGGPKGKKYSIRQLRESLLGVHKLQMNEQKNQLAINLEKWEKGLEQVDDVLLMGIKF